MKKWWIAIGLLCVFALWTVAVSFVDVSPIGPNGSTVGFATLNGWFHRLTGVHMSLYVITDWLGLVPVAVCLAFAVLGLCQWMNRKSIAKVDCDLLLMGAFYVVTIAVYLLFETVVINYRPVLMEGFLEVAYPSSTSLLVLCVMPTALMWLRSRTAPRWIVVVIVLFIVFMVLGRLISGVHWLTDILGGVFLGGGLTMAYAAACDSLKKR